ncbi:uncharacterized protein LOC116093854 [Mastomys coucha]|uniref:uncharacterized protein LOC116093854 n=1 Tax=Mastomys coucha TaxID=35658 RepID=UPI001261D8E4|nr:uncharacterized protein LOC116093854 [Mastomys coucha]
MRRRWEMLFYRTVGLGACMQLTWLTEKPRTGSGFEKLATEFAEIPLATMPGSQVSLICSSNRDVFVDEMTGLLTKRGRKWRHRIRPFFGIWRKLGVCAEVRG